MARRFGLQTVADRRANLKPDTDSTIMDLREAQHLEGVTIIDPKASRVRQFIVVALTRGRNHRAGMDRLRSACPRRTGHRACCRGSAAAVPVAGTDSPSRQVTGTIPDDASKPVASIRLAAPSPAASAAASSPSAATPPTDANAASAPGLKLDTEFASAKRIVPFAFNRSAWVRWASWQSRNSRRWPSRPTRSTCAAVPMRSATPAPIARSRVDRAHTVYSAFLREGVQKQKLRLTYCSTCFVASNDTEAGRRLNRRVEVELIMPRDDIAKLPKPVHAPESPPPLVAPLAASEILQTISR